MKAITLYQPRASLIAIGAKKYETRSWATNYRGEIAIHAGKKPFENIRTVSELEFWNAAADCIGRSDWDDNNMPLFGSFDCGFITKDQLPLGAVIATAELVNCWRIVAHPGTNIDVAKNIPIGAESMTTDKHSPDFGDYFIPSEQEIIFGDWTPGRYAWELANVKMLTKPIPCKGRQGLWNWERV